MSNVELYEALKGRVGEAAARMIAEVFPPARNLATKEDLAGLDARMAEREVRLVERIAEVESRIMGRLWVMFVPLWIGVFGLIATLLVRGG